MRAKAYSRRFGSEEAEEMAVRIQHHPDMLLRAEASGWDDWLDLRGVIALRQMPGTGLVSSPGFRTARVSAS
jgi:hypothetical protein